MLDEKERRTLSVYLLERQQIADEKKWGCLVAFLITLEEKKSFIAELSKKSSALGLLARLMECDAELQLWLRKSRDLRKDLDFLDENPGLQDESLFLLTGSEMQAESQLMVISIISKLCMYAEVTLTRNSN